MTISYGQTVKTFAARRILILIPFCLAVFLGAMTPQEELQARIEAEIYSGCGARKLLKDDICDIAQETRAFVKSLIAKGMTEQEILAAVEERYGTAILAIPERNWLGKLSYMLPYLVAGLGLTLLSYFLKGRSIRPSERPSVPSASIDEDRKKKIEEQILSDL